MQYSDLDPVYTVPDPQGHDIKLNTFKTSVALKFMIILQNLTTANHRKSGESKYDGKLTESTSQSENIISLNRLS